MDTRAQIDRHRDYDEKTMLRVAKLLGAGEPLTRAAPECGVPRTTVLAWVAAIPAAADIYARARENQADAHFDEIVMDAKRLQTAALKNLISTEQIQAFKVAIDARKWAAAKLKPKIYGDRIDLAVEQATTLILLDYGRSKPLTPQPHADAIDVTPLPQLGAGEGAQPLITERKRIPKRERVARMSPKRRAKYEANRAKLEAARAAFQAAQKAETAKRKAKGSSSAGSRKKRGRG